MNHSDLCFFFLLVIILFYLEVISSNDWTFIQLVLQNNDLFIFTIVFLSVEEKYQDCVK